MDPQAQTGTGSRTIPFWETRAFVVLAVLIATVPLLWPNVPPLTDLPGHMGRYRVQLGLGHSPALAEFYGFRWSLIGNLGVDLLVMPLAWIFGLELAVKLIVIAIPALTVAGFLWVAREVHGRVPPTALFALPFAYGHPFQFGFVNFALSMAFALLAFALWLRLARFGRFRLRAVLFVPISLLIWVTHTFGWGMLGLMAFSAEAVRQHDTGRSYIRAAIGSAIHCLPMAPPLLLMLLWRSGHVGGFTTDWFNWKSKWRWIVMTLRDRWEWFDKASLVLVVLVLLEAIRNRRLEYSRNLAFSAIVLVAFFILLPRIVFGSAYADMRLAPYLFAVALIAIRFRPSASARTLKLWLFAALAFFLVRTGANTVSLIMWDKVFDRELAALDKVPEGARMLTFVGANCGQPWSLPRTPHLPGMAIVRRDAFSNDQWVMPGAQLLRVRFRPAWPFLNDPSQLVTFRKCPREVYRPIALALLEAPRRSIDYVWLIQPPPFPSALTTGMTPIWRNGTSTLYRVRRYASREDGEKGNPGWKRDPANQVALESEDSLKRGIDGGRG